MNPKDDLSISEASRLTDSTHAENAAAVQPFAPDQMNACPACRRANPPTRLNCFYCGAQLEITERNQNFVRPTGRKLEAWEKGFNVVNLSGIGENSKINLPETANFLRLEIKDLQGILSRVAPLPLARVESMEEAQLVRAQLEKAGLSTAVVADARLEPEKPLRRVRALDFGDDRLGLRFSGNSEIVRLDYRDLKIAVVGAIFRSRREESERRTRSGETKRIGDASEFTADERILDFYAAGDAVGNRISAGSFDFSCLGKRKGLLARENFGILLDEFRRLAPDAPIDESYQKTRPLLNAVWSVEERRESAGWQHDGIGKINVESVTTASNETQFTRYSRMLAALSPEPARGQNI